jgi:hypothetical protein
MGEHVDQSKSRIQELEETLREYKKQAIIQEKIIKELTLYKDSVDKYIKSIETTFKK